MLTCNIEYESPLWRDGMTAGLDAGIRLGWRYRHNENGFRCRLRRGMVETAPQPYRRYMRAYDHQTFYPGILPTLLTHWQWRTYAAELAGLAAQAARTGTAAPGDQEGILRSALLLAPGEASAAPYQALLAAGESVDPAPQARDGCIDAAVFCSVFVEECDLTPTEFIKVASRRMYWLLPKDYLRYARRRAARRAVHRGQYSCFLQSPAPCRLQVWRCNVSALAAEIASCEAAGAGQSQRWLDLVEWLLLKPNEGVPNPDWEMPPAMAEHYAALNRLTLLA